jgi:hypothetical protein
MRISLVPLAVSGLVGALLGFSAAAVWLRDGRPVPAMTPIALRPASEADGRRMRASEDVGSGPGANDSGGNGGDAAAMERSSRAVELKELRAREQASREQLSVQRKRIAQLESELEKERPRGQERRRNELDLRPEDWRRMAAEGVMKYRVPCGVPGDEALDGLGLAPDDRDAVREAFESWAGRLREGLVPLCAAALGDRRDVAEALSTEACRQVVMSTAADRSESQLLSAHHVAAFMAGDGPRPGADSALGERLFLVLAEESKQFENELAGTFGPEEAHRLAFSERLCFRTSTHNYVNRP